MLKKASPIVTSIKTISKLSSKRKPKPTKGAIVINKGAKAQCTAQIELAAMPILSTNVCDFAMPSQLYLAPKTKNFALIRLITA